MTNLFSPLSVPLVVSFLVLSACGVRGRPQPPLTPAELGRGQPTFRRATEEFAFPNVPSPEATPEATPPPRPGAGKKPAKPYGN